MRLSLIVSVNILMVTGVLVAAPARGQLMEKVQVEITLKDEPLSAALLKIERQTPFTFLYRNEDIDRVKSLNLPLSKMSVNDLLQTLLTGTPLVFKQVNKRIVINTAVTTETHPVQPFIDAVADTNSYVLKGKVIDAVSRAPIPNASVVSGQTHAVAAANGTFHLLVMKGGTLRISCIGYEPVEIIVKDKEDLVVEMKSAEQVIKEVVVNGLFVRRAESFTGAVTTFSGKELKRVGNINVLQSLAILDPSFRMFDNLQFGSDPNRIPEVQIRGQSSMPDVNLNTTYKNAPNLPLFILDGFETTIQRVYDLNLNMVASITLLKDASAKAIYGAKAGNGVVVITTRRPGAGKLRVAYTGSVDVEAPDLSSYHLTNALQKLQAEQRSGKYSSTDAIRQYELTRQYQINMQQALSGVNTYWLAQPLRNGLGQKHHLYLDGGTETMRYAASISYNDEQGVMKGSDRKTISGGLTLQYRKDRVAFTNDLSITANNSRNSPYGKFGNYTRMNPYWKLYDSTGKLIRAYAVNGSSVYNPLYNATLHTLDAGRYTTITENFYGEWNAANNLRFTARVGITGYNEGSDYFLPGNAVEYAAISPADSGYLNRGIYTVSNNRGLNLSTDIGASYSFTFGKSQVFTNLIGSARQQSNSSTGMTAVGFASDKLDNISFAKAYQPGTKPAGTESTSRELGVTTAINYSFDNRYLADFSLRESASSKFGANNRWAPFWSLGLGWNLHQEKFMPHLHFINQLRLRGTTGITGTQNFSPYQSLSSYNYNTRQIYNGDLGLYLLGLANPDLRWQQVRDNNLGVDISFCSSIDVSFNYYISDTRHLLSDQTLPPSTGFPNYKENVGETRNQGFELNGRARVYRNAHHRIYVAVFGSVTHNQNRIRKVSNALKSLNDKQDALLNGGGGGGGDELRRVPVTRFAEGQSMSAIWGVRSLGIDPANGKEIFLRRDGTQTYAWNAADQVVIGDGQDKYAGSFGANMQWKNFTFNFAFQYKLGGQLYNKTLIDKVENADINYNVDIRVLEGRWNTPGQQSLYKDITDYTVTRPTSRFVQNNAELLFSSINIGYDMSRLSFVKQLKMSTMTLTLNANNLGRLGTVKTERGTDYPFARTISMALNTTF